MFATLNEFASRLEEQPGSCVLFLVDSFTLLFISIPIRFQPATNLPQQSKVIDCINMRVFCGFLRWCAGVVADDTRRCHAWGKGERQQARSNRRRQSSTHHAYVFGFIWISIIKNSYRLSMWRYHFCRFILFGRNDITHEFFKRPKSVGQQRQHQIRKYMRFVCFFRI